MSDAAKSILTTARENIKTGWTQQAFARTASGEATFSHSVNAICFCMMGAVHRARSEHPQYLRLGSDDPINRALKAAINASPDDDLLCAVSRFNDAPGRTQAEVIAAFDRAIENLEPTDAR